MLKSWGSSHWGPLYPASHLSRTHNKTVWCHMLHTLGLCNSFVFVSWFKLWHFTLLPPHFWWHPLTLTLVKTNASFLCIYLKHLQRRPLQTCRWPCCTCWSHISRERRSRRSCRHTGWTFPGRNLLRDPQSWCLKGRNEKSETQGENNKGIFIIDLHFITYWFIVSVSNTNLYHNADNDLLFSLVSSLFSIFNGTNLP